jgi:3-ketosteroid 9alpha-monooxygenase subunit B
VTLRDRYHALPVKRVVRETDDAISIVFDVPDALASAYAYAAGQFVTLRVVVDGEPQLRSYSMSSAPGIDQLLQVTVKRVPDGLISNWLNDRVREHDEIEVSTPAGAFTLADEGDDVVAFAAGSGITPIFSIVKAALHTTERRIRLLFANREQASAIFARELDDLAQRFDGRLVIAHHEDVVSGFLEPDDVIAFTGDQSDADFYICGPTGFMDIVEAALIGIDTDPARIHIERFTPADSIEPSVDAQDDSAPTINVTITLGGETQTIAHRGTSTILQTARWGGLRAPSSCEAGHCATCMAQLVEGRVEMLHNDALTPDEVAEGWVLTCQSVPVTPIVRVVYDP